MVKDHRYYKHCCEYGTGSSAYNTIYADVLLFSLQTEHLEVALEDEHAQYLQLQHLLGEKEKAIQQLQEEREFLDKQYGYTKKEVWSEGWAWSVTAG